MELASDGSGVDGGWGQGEGDEDAGKGKGKEKGYVWGWGKGTEERHGRVHERESKSMCVHKHE